MIVTRPTVSIIKASKLADVSRRTIYNWIYDKKVETIRTAGGNVRIFVDTLFKANDPTDPEVIRRIEVSKKNVAERYS